MIFNEVKIKPKMAYDKYVCAKFKEPIETRDYFDEEAKEYTIDATDVLGFRSSGRTQEQAIEKFNTDIIMLCDTLFGSRDLNEVFEAQREILMHYVDVKAFAEEKENYNKFIQSQKKAVDMKA